MTTPYDEEFFALHSGSSRSSAQVVLAPVLECLRPESLVDVGGGIGEWASVAKELGVAEVLVVDGDYVDQSQLHVNTSEFLPNDLGVSLNLPRRFDLVLSLEVAEHLSATRAESFIRDLSYLTDAVLFSAAVPGQGGTAHVNERWQNYWAGLFSAKGFEVFDVVRSAIWYDDRVSFWYRQNTFLFARGDSADRLRDLPRSVMPLDLVHPEFMQEVSRRESEPLRLREAARSFGRALLGSASHRLGRTRYRPPPSSAL
jgi:hypothetical protein